MKDAQTHNVFISYRRDNGSALAQLVYQHLKRRGYRVFMDVRDLGSGAFDEELKQKLKNAMDVVVLVTPNCFERCANEDDWFRVEIETALANGCNVVPLRTEDAELPSPDDLPDSIARVPKHQSVKFNSEYCDAGLNRLCQMLKAPRQRVSTRTVALVAMLLLLVIASGTALAVRALNPPRPIESGEPTPTATPVPTPIATRQQPLALYWFGFAQRKVGDQWQELFLRDGMTLYSGDQFRLEISPNQDCYVYVVNVDAAGQAFMLFPNQEIQQSNFCRANQHFHIPDGTNWFTLDENTGMEAIYLFADDEPVEELESLKTAPALDAEIVTKLNQMASGTRGVGIEPDGRLATTTFTSGKEVKMEMQVVAASASAIEVIHFKHESAADKIQNLKD